jgi:hypothetical protein
MARSTLDIWPRVFDTADTVRYEFDLEYSDRPRTGPLFYELARADAPTRPDSFDGILCAVVCHAMADGRDIRLHGPATRTMLLNLAEFQLAWNRWLPAVYRPVQIEADTVITTTAPRSTRSIAAFSGGADSAFTLLRNHRHSATPGYGVDTVLMVHGFDVRLANEPDLHELIERTASIRTLTGVQLRVVRTNSKELRLQKWEDSFGAQLAACMHLFSAEFSAALLGSSESYDALVLPLGSSPVTDHLLSGEQMKFVHDGAAFSRTDKIAFISQSPAAVASLKVCWEGAQQGRNCGICEKCVRTKLNFLAAGMTQPSCFDEPLDLRLIADVPIRNDAIGAEFRSIVDYADHRHTDEEWLRLLRKRLRRGKQNRTAKSRLRSVLATTGLLGTVRTARRMLAPGRRA